MLVIGYWVDMAADRSQTEGMRSVVVAGLTDELLRDALASFPFVQVTVTGSCMEPAVREGAPLRLVAASRRPPRFGDIVLTTRAERWRLHRLVWGPPFTAPGETWRTMADRAVVLDPPLHATDITAIALTRERWPLRCFRTLVALSRAMKRVLINFESMDPLERPQVEPPLRSKRDSLP
jgi:hypothetical protein